MDPHLTKATDWVYDLRGNCATIGAGSWWGPEGTPGKYQWWREPDTTDGMYQIDVQIRELNSDGTYATGSIWGTYTGHNGWSQYGNCGNAGEPAYTSHVTINGTSLVPHLAIRFVGPSWAGSPILGEAKSVAPPAAPSDLSVSNASSCSVSLAWTDNSSNEDAFEIERSKDSGSTWTELDVAPTDATSYVDSALTAAQYRYRVRATNFAGVSDWSNTVDATIDSSAECDTDGDGLLDDDERVLGTNPKKQDTDGDGLLDPWEVQDPDIEGDGFRLNEFPNLVVERDQVFGPYSTNFCEGADPNLRLPEPTLCFNAPPDPLHKDVYLEIDWQDCEVSGCPEIDPMHHAPDALGLGLAIGTFEDAPVTNPDGRSGIDLHIVVDERIGHQPNCDQDASAMRAGHFGTVAQRESTEVIAAKSRAVRYVWSGHSSRFGEESQCPDPGFLGIAFHQSPLPAYDRTPFGDVNAGGDDLLVTIGPMWSCPSQIETTVFIHPCYRSYVGRPDVAEGRPEYSASFPGIFPTWVEDDDGTLELPFPISRLLGLSEDEGRAFLWSRTLVHLLGHAMGMTDEGLIGNLPDQPPPDIDADGMRDLTRPSGYALWTGLQLAPGGPGLPLSESLPSYSSLVSQDLDNDGVAEGDDNCPGVHNSVAEWLFGTMESQPDNDFDMWGDACDADSDGDGMMESAATNQNSRSSDPYPLDTDNDGLRNTSDLDDDGDAILDLADNCLLVPNRTQGDSDLDGWGNACDIDVLGLTFEP